MKPQLSELLTPPKIILLSKRSVLYIIFSIIIISLFLPWFMFTSGMGRVTAVNPSERIQEINAPISGFIDKWHVQEGSVLKKGDLLVELIDADPSLMERIQREKDAANSALESTQLALKTAKLNLARQEQLFKEGLSSRKEYEKSQIDVSKLEVEVSKALATLTKAQTQVSRQSSQVIVAPRDGKILRLLPGEGNQLIKAGDPLVVFAPTVTYPAVELWIAGNDIPFVKVGQKARLQFEGWPTVQIPGWPSVAVGTFKAQVKLVDYASSSEGKFRVLLVKDENHPWPGKQFLRLNANARGIIYFRKTMVGFEIWRQLNAFPPLEDPIKDELDRLLHTAIKSKMKSKTSQEAENKETVKP